MARFVRPYATAARSVVVTAAVDRGSLRCRSHDITRCHVQHRGSGNPEELAHDTY